MIFVITLIFKKHIQHNKKKKMMEESGKQKKKERKKKVRRMNEQTNKRRQKSCGRWASKVACTKCHGSYVFWSAGYVCWGWKKKLKKEKGFWNGEEEEEDKRKKKDSIKIVLMFLVCFLLF